MWEANAIWGWNITINYYLFGCFVGFVGASIVDLHKIVSDVYKDGGENGFPAKKYSRKNFIFVSLYITYYATAYR